MALPVRIALLAIVYAAAARAGLLLDAVSGFATLVWPPTGIALAALLLRGDRMWPGVAIGAFVANVWTGAPPLVAVGMAAGNTLEALAATWLLRRVGFRARAAGVRDVLALCVLAGLLATTVSATIGVGSLAAGGALRASFAATWRAWWLGDVMGALVVTPCVIALAHLAPVRRRVPEAIGLALALAGIGAFVFAPSAISAELRETYLVFPPLIWAALRFGVRGAALGMAGVSALAIAGTVLGGGPFGSGGALAGRLMALQAFLAIVAIAVLVLGAVSDERDAAVRKREELLEVVSHELKNPLSAIQIATETIVAKLPSVDDRLHKRAVVVQRQAERMSSLIQSLLDLGALEAGRLAIERHDEDARAIVDEVVELMRPMAADNGQDLTTVVPDAPLHVSCDRERVLQILVNLVSNAIKYAPRGTPITVTLADDGARVRFAVRDTGPGIPADQLAHVFERYWQARPSGARRGSGLGMFIAKTLAEAHGGTIAVTSTPGEGSEFAVVLPR